MTTVIDKKYRKEKLLDWERKSLTDKFSIFSFSKKSTWATVGLTTLGLCVFGFIVPFIAPRYGWGNWTPATTSDEYQYRLTNFWISVPIMIFSVFAYVNICNKIDLVLGIKRTANFKVTEVLNVGVIKILFMNGWRPFSIKARQPYFKSAIPRQIITIKRTGTFRLIDYYIRDEKTYNDEQERKLATNIAATQKAEFRVPKSVLWLNRH
ncbi:hypothetical protein [Dyadobacter sp. 32]|uniref:hypothetical protein n=1 Tax=Dyadobacter sp. 32 TaxID=538966 RepID=UPI0011EE073B